MKQVLQDAQTGEIAVEEVPAHGQSLAVDAPAFIDAALRSSSSNLMTRVRNESWRRPS